MARKSIFRKKLLLWKAIVFIAIIASGLLYALLWQPQLREQNRQFIVQRSAETLKTFATLSLIKGSIEVAKQIPAIKALAGRAEPAEELVDLLWRFSLFSFVWHQVLAIYIETDWLFRVPLALVLLYLLALYFPYFSYFSGFSWLRPSFGRFSDEPPSKIGTFVHSHARILYLPALFLAVLLPLYILFSARFYRYYEEQHILPRYRALAQTFTPVQQLAKQRQQQEEGALQMREGLAAEIAQNRERAQTIEGEIETLEQKIARLKQQRGWRHWFLRKSEEQQKLEERRRKLSKESRQILETIGQQNRELLRAQGKGLGGLWDSAKSYLGDAKNYIEAYSQSFVRLISAEGQNNLRSYVFHKLTLAVCYFFIFPVLLLLLLRAAFPQQPAEQIRTIIRAELARLPKTKK